MSEKSQKALLSYDYGASPVKLIGVTLPRFFDDLVAVQPDVLALISCRQKVRYTYAQLKERVDLFAGGLIQSGIERGDRVGIWSTNNAEWIITQLATAKVGAILVNINPGYKAHELEYALNQSGVKLLVTLPQHRDSNYLHILRSLAESLFDSEGRGGTQLPSLETIVVIDGVIDGACEDREEIEKALKSPAGAIVSFESVVQRGQQIEPSSLRDRAAQLQFDDPVNIQYTSGTTGLPKGVTLSHHNLLNNAWLAAVAMKLKPSSRFCIPMPFYHCGGMVSSSLATITAGGTVVVPGPFFDELDVLTAVQEEKCTHLSGVPTMFIAELDHPRFDEFDLSSLHGGFMAGAPCPVQLMRRVADKLHMHEVVILYGLTEASPLITSTIVEDSLEVRATTVGRVIPGIEVKIIDQESNQVVERGRQGELCTRGHGVMLGYWNNESATHETIDQNGWLHSGDLAVMNEDGFVNITGRKKDMIIRGGENIYPREIEEVLHHHPSIAQAQVFGIPDERMGEEVALWITVKPGCALEPDEVRVWLKEQIAHFKVPRHIKTVNGFPMTVTGKVQKFVMRQLMIEELGLEKASKIQTA